MKLKGAIAGCGMISEFHLAGWNRIPEVEIVALYNRTITRAEERRDQFIPQARVYDNLETLLGNEEIDFIDILTPPALHREHCLMASESNIHIICQKPLADSYESASDLVNRLKNYPKLFAIHENHRYRPWFRTIREKQREGFFGSLSFVHIEHLDATEPAEPYKNKSEAGVLLEYGSHLIDMMRSLLGEPHKVFARVHHINSRVHGESFVHAAFEYPDATAVIDAAWKDAALMQGSLLASGTVGEAWYEGTLTRGPKARFRLSKDKQVILDEWRCPSDDYRESFYFFELECVNAMLGRHTTEQTGAAHLKTLQCCFAAYEAAATGKIIEISARSC